MTVEPSLIMMTMGPAQIISSRVFPMSVSGMPRTVWLAMRSWTELADIPDGDGIFVALSSSQQVATVVNRGAPHVAIVTRDVHKVVDLVVLKGRALRLLFVPRADDPREKQFFRGVDYWKDGAVKSS
jgi:hypothetical protein